MNSIVQERFAKIRALTKQKNVFKWQNVCQSINSSHNLAEIQKFARIFGVPPVYWDNPRKVCSLITPRVTDYLEKVYCDNADEPTMEGDPVGGIPEYLKYTYKASNGKIYCYSIVDLYNAVQHGQIQDPYRRFTLDSNSIIQRYDFLKSIIEPQGLASTIMDNIKNIALVLSPNAIIRNKLSSIWEILRYPKYTIDEIVNASEEILNGLWMSISTGEGLATQITNQEREMFMNAQDKATKLNILVDTMHRLIHNDELGVVPVALELAINNSVERPNEIPSESRRRRRSSAISNGRNVRQRVEIDEERCVNVNSINFRTRHTIIRNMRNDYYNYEPRGENKILFMDDFSSANGYYFIPRFQNDQPQEICFLRTNGDVKILFDGVVITRLDFNDDSSDDDTAGDSSDDDTAGDSSDDEFADFAERYELEPENPEYNLRSLSYQNVNTINERALSRVKSNLRAGHYGFTYRPREHKILFQDDFDVNGSYFIPKSEIGRRNPNIWYRRQGDEIFIYVDGNEIIINEMNS